MRKRYPFIVDAWILLPNHLNNIRAMLEGNNDFPVRWNGSNVFLPWFGEKGCQLAFDVSSKCYSRRLSEQSKGSALNKSKNNSMAGS